MTTDIYGRQWDLPPEELCPQCGQPDNCGDCNHHRLTDEDVRVLRGEEEVEASQTPDAEDDPPIPLTHSRLREWKHEHLRGFLGHVGRPTTLGLRGEDPLDGVMELMPSYREMIATALSPAARWGTPENRLAYDYPSDELTMMAGHFGRVLDAIEASRRRRPF